MAKPQIKSTNSHVVLLEGRRLVEGAENFVEKCERTLSPDHKATKVTTRGELEDVQSADVDELNTRKVAERLDDTLVLVVDNEGTTALAVTAVPQFALTGAELARVRDLDDVGIRLEGLEECDSLLGLGERLGLVSDDKGHLLDLLDTVATGKDKRGKRRSSERRNYSEAALVLVDLDMPLTPGLGGREHATTTAHVTEGSLRNVHINKCRRATMNLFT